MTERLRVQERSHLERDVRTKAILNTDRASLDKYKEERERAKKMARLFEEVEYLKQEVTELRELCKSLSDLMRSRNVDAGTADVDQ